MVDGAGKPRHWGTVGHTLKRSARVKDKVERLIDITACIMDVLEDQTTTPLVAIEGYAYAAPGAQNDLGELHGVVKSQLWLGLMVEPELIPPTHARKVVLGKGRIGKTDIMEHLTSRAIECKNHNEADAYVVAECLRLRHVENQNG